MAPCNLHAQNKCRFTGVGNVMLISENILAIKIKKDKCKIIIEINIKKQNI